jgi:1,4-alpha-glucan branching enzyme
LLFVSNFTPLERHNYACGVPFPGDWHEILNTDAAVYGGMDRGNCGSAHATKMPRDLQPCTLTLYLPPLSTLIFEYK